MQFIVVIVSNVRKTLKSKFMKMFFFLIGVVKLHKSEFSMIRCFSLGLFFTRYTLLKAFIPHFKRKAPCIIFPCINCCWTMCFYVVWIKNTKVLPFVNRISTTCYKYYYGHLTIIIWMISAFTGNNGWIIYRISLKHNVNNMVLADCQFNLVINSSIL